MNNPKFKIYKKGQITQAMKENKNPTYKDQGLTGHTGIDWFIGHGKVVSSDNDGFCYKVFNPGDNKSNWTGVYVLTKTSDPEVYMEICMGHFRKCLVNVGEQIQSGQPIGEQGGYGNVWSGGRRIPVEEQNYNNPKGSHVHESWRPVRRTKTRPERNYRLYDNSGTYQDKEGYYYEVINKDNGLRGNINPMTYVETQKDIRQDSSASKNRPDSLVELTNVFKKYRKDPSLKPYAKAFLLVAINNK